MGRGDENRLHQGLAPYIDSTGWKQGEVDCANRLNQTLLKEFKAFDKPEDSIWGN